MPNPLSAYGVRDIDYAMSIGVVMGEAMHEGLVGMGLVAATALNRAQNPGAYLARSAALGDIFAAPHDAVTMARATLEGRSLSGKGRQFSPTFNSNISGASTAGHQNFKAGLQASLMASLDPEFSPMLGERQASFERAKLATEVATKARSMGIDIGLGVENFSAPGFESKAGVGRNRSRVGGHSVSPTGGWSRGTKAPTASEFASRFAVAAKMAGVAIPDEMVADITAYTDRAQIMAAAPVIQRQAQDFMGQQLKQDVMPGIAYDDLVQPTGFGAVDVPDVTGKLGIGGANALGFADHFGITPNNDYETVSLPDQIGRVDFGGYLDPVGPAPSLEAFTPLEAAPVDLSDMRQGMTEAQAIQSLGLENQRPASNVEVRPSPFGLSIDDQVAMHDAAVGPLDLTARTLGGQLGPLGVAVDEDSLTTGFVPDPAPGSFGVWGGQGAFNDAFQGGYADPTFTRSQEVPDAISPLGSIGMGETFGIDMPRDYSDITAGILHDDLPGFTPSSPAAVDLSDVAAPQPASPGYVAGVDAGPWGHTPDFGAPSLEQRNAQTFAQDRINAFESGLAPGFRQNDIDTLNANLMAELAPSTPQLAAAPLSTPNGAFGLDGFQAATSAPSAFDLAFSAPNTMGGVSAQPSMMSAPSMTVQGYTAPSSAVAMGDVDMPSTTASTAAPSRSYARSSLPETAPLPPTRPDDTFSLGPFGWGEKGLTIGGYQSPIDAIKSGLGISTKPDHSFMNAMASPQYANSYTPGFLDSSLGRTLTGALKGSVFGGIPGAVFGGVLGGTGWGNRMSNQVDDFFGAMFDHAKQGWSGYDFASHGYGRGYNERGERSPTGPNDSGTATLGDGSYGERSGTNPNNPQGIL